MCQFGVKSHDTLTYFPLPPFAKYTYVIAYTSTGDLEHLLALEEQHYLILAAALLIEEPEPEIIPRRRPRTPRRYWGKPWLLRRPLFGQYENLLYELHREDSKGYQNFLCMSPELFNVLVERVGPLITKKDTFYRKALDP